MRFYLAAVLTLAAAPAFAQSPYVAGSIGADISRFSHSESDFAPFPSNGSEVLNGSLRVGTAVGSNWGVDLEFVRAGRSSSSTPVLIPLLQAAGRLTDLVGTFTTSIGVAPIPIDSRTEVRTRRSDLDATIWARQTIGDRVDLVYLAGVAFSRVRSEMTDTFIPGPRLPPQTFRSTFIEYGTHPLVGVEARIGLTSKLRLLPGFRFQGLGDGWLMRPSVGLGWFF